MKKVLLFFIACVLFSMVGCKPVNPPSSDEVSSVLDLCYAAMGQSGEKLQDDLAGLGIKIPEIDPVGQYRCYKLNTKSYNLDFSTIDDEVVILHYEILFKDTYINGISKYWEISNQMIGHDWEEWRGSASGYYSEMNNVEQRPEFINDITAIVASCKESHFSVYERAKTSLGSNKIYATWEYWATDPSGMNPDTGEGLSSLYESSVMVEFEISEDDYSL